MSDYLPVDVLVEILSRLPVKSLLKFTCVCKQWYSIILSPNFISKHLNESLSSSTNEDQLVLVRNYNMFSETERFALHFDNELFNEHKELECPFSRVNDYFRIVGSCNGLICLADDYDSHTDTIIIWNPSVRKSVTLPKPLFTSPPQGAHLLGFGFDALHNDYKVVRIVYHLNIPGDHHYSIPPKVEIYTLSTGLWRNICDAAPMYDIFNYFPSPAFLNGSVHWVGSKRGDDGSFHNLISAVDMSTEVFKEIMMPNSLAETEVLKLAISTLGTSLALIQYEKIWQSEYCWVWVMKEYGMAESWTRLFKIDMRDGIRKVVGFQKTNEVLLSARVRGLISYHPNIQQIEYLGIHGTNRSLYVDSFVESLVLLKGGNRVLQLENYRDAVIGEIERLVLGEGSN